MYEIPALLPNVRQVELFIERRPNCTTREIADTLGLAVQAVAMNTHRLRMEGRIRRTYDEGDRRVRWHSGIEEGIEPREEREYGLPNQRIVSEWEPHNCRDPLVAYLFG
jgi:DNA-binding MarR family transcriptional regulator